MMTLTVWLPHIEGRLSSAGKQLCSLMNAKSSCIKLACSGPANIRDLNHQLNHQRTVIATHKAVKLQAPVHTCCVFESGGECTICK
jgi:hypothetical protein